jgi:hypothetical protein
MKIIPTLFAVVVIMLVAAVSYYIGGSMQGRQSIHTPITETEPFQRNAVKATSQEQITISNTPQTASKQAEAIETKSKTDNQGVLTGADIKPPAPGYLTGPSQPSNQVSSTLPSTPTLPSSSQNAVEDLNLRYKLYLDIAKTEYDNEIANAGKNSFLVQKAQLRYTLSVAKIESWRRRIENAFRMINLDNRITEEERQMNKDRVLNTIEEPMYAPKRIELLPDEPK